MSTARVCGPMSMFNTLLRRDAGRKRVLDERHLRDGVGNLDQFRRAAAPRDDDVYVRRTTLQRLDDRTGFDPTIEQWIGQLVQHNEKVLAARDRLGRPLPSGASQLRGAL